MAEDEELAPKPCSASKEMIAVHSHPRALGVLILAGGEGRRIGGDKPLRQLGGASLLERALKRASQFSPAISVGLRYPGQMPVPADAEIVVDFPGMSGPIAALAAGLAWADARGLARLLTLPCDAPFVPANLSERLYLTAQRFGVPVALPSRLGRLHPACGLWSVQCQQQLAKYTAAGRSSLIGLAEGIGFASVAWDGEVEDPFLNINTLADLAAAEARIAHPHLE